MHNTETVILPTDTETMNIKLYALAFSGLKLRNATSLLNRINMVQQDTYLKTKPVRNISFVIHCKGPQNEAPLIK